MALGKCRECGRECAQSAKVCPGCGVAHPVKGWTTGAKLGLLLIALVVVWMIVTAGEKPHAVSAATTTNRSAAPRFTRRAPATKVLFDWLDPICMYICPPLNSS